MRLAGSFMGTALYFPLWFLRVNSRVYQINRSNPKLSYFRRIVVLCAVISVGLIYIPVRNAVRNAHW